MRSQTFRDPIVMFLSFFFQVRPIGLYLKLSHALPLYSSQCRPSFGAEDSDPMVSSWCDRATNEGEAPFLLCAKNLWDLAGPWRIQFLSWRFQFRSSQRLLLKGIYFQSIKRRSDVRMNKILGWCYVEYNQSFWPEAPERSLLCRTSVWQELIRLKKIKTTT